MFLLPVIIGEEDDFFYQFKNDQFITMRPTNLFLKIIIISILFSNVQAQTSVNGKVVDSTYKPISFCIVGLMNASDTGLVNGTISDEAGNFSFTATPLKNYIIKVAAVGYYNFYTTAFKIDSLKNYQIPTIQLKQQEVNLNEVSVTALKPVIEVKNGAITMNIENTSLATGNTVFDLIKKLPGVFVNNDNTISLSGKSGVQVMIDGKLQRLSPDQLASVLMSMSAETVSKIDLLRNPPVKYDAQGTAGLINIITKKASLFGFSGNISLALNKGDFYRNNSDASLSYKGKKFMLTGNLSVADRTFYHNYSFDRKITVNDSVSDWDKTGYGINHQKVISYKLTGDYFINERTTVGFFYGNMKNAGMVQSANLTTISNYNNFGFDQLNGPASSTEKISNPSYNVNFEHKFDSLGTSIKIAADYSNYSGNLLQLNKNYFLENNGQSLMPDLIYRSNALSRFNLFTQTIDLNKNFKKNIFIEAGVKGSIANNSNTYIFEKMDNSSGLFYKDTMLTNHYIYEERIAAGYFNVRKKFTHATLQMGCRAENTIINAYNKDSEFKIKRNYLNFFPNIIFDYSRSSKHAFQLNLNKRIIRPGYAELNPYEWYYDYYTIYKGNPYLMPTINYGVSIMYSYKSMVYNTIGIGKDVNSFLNYNYQVDSLHRNINSVGNISGRHVYYYTLFVQKQIGSFWNFSFNGNSYYSDFSGTLNGTYFKTAYYGFDFSINNDLTLPKKFKVLINSFYTSPVTYGTAKYNKFGSVDVGLKKALLKDKLNISLLFSDIFFTYFYTFKVDFQNLHSAQVFTMDTRRVAVSVSYSFGKLKVQHANRSSNAAEKERLNSQR